MNLLTGASLLAMAKSIYYLIVKDIYQWRIISGGDGGLIETGGLLTFFPWKGGDLLEGGGLFERGGLIEDKRYICNIYVGWFPQWRHQATKLVRCSDCLWSRFGDQEMLFAINFNIKFRSKWTKSFNIRGKIELKWTFASASHLADEFASGRKI